jgi:hypothetical protein
LKIIKKKKEKGKGKVIDKKHKDKNKCGEVAIKSYINII